MKKIAILLLLSAFFNACTQRSGGESEDAGVQEESVMEQSPLVLSVNGITLTEVFSPQFDDAKIGVNTPVKVDASGKATFDFMVDNYELGAQTSDAGTKDCANSAQGQHIHLILNNGPYTAHYESAFEQDVNPGSYVGLAFLSRSYHESVKSPGAYTIFRFSSGEESDQVVFDENSAHMFYSRPKGTYTGEDTKKVLLDFYLVNTNLSEEGYKVKAVINGTEFILTKWVPYAMEGLPMGENTISLTLLDPEGNVVESPFNPVTRTITLEGVAQ